MCSHLYCRIVVPMGQKCFEVSQCGKDCGIAEEVNPTPLHSEWTAEGYDPTARPKSQTVTIRGMRSRLFVLLGAVIGTVRISIGSSRYKPCPSSVNHVHSNRLTFDKYDDVSRRSRPIDSKY